MSELNPMVIIISVASLFIMTVPGVLIKKFKLVDNSAGDVLATLLLYVTQPAMILVAFMRKYDPQILGQAMIILVGGFIVHFATYLLSKLLFRKAPEEHAKALRFITIFSNCGYMGFPVLKAIFGPDGDLAVLYATMYTVSFNVLMWTLGVGIFTGRGKMNLRRALINPGTVPTFFALLIFIFSVTVPKEAKSLLETLGNMTAPLSMLLIGLRLTDLKWKSAFADIHMYLGIALRLVLIPLSVLGLSLLLGFKGLPMYVLYIVTAMPAAAATTIFAQRFNGDAVYSSKLVLVSTALSVATIPLMLLLL